MTFEIYGSNSNLHEAQIVEIKKRDKLDIQTETKKAWGELKEFVEGKQDEGPVFAYHLATAQAGLRDGDGALLSLEYFLERAQNQYFHYGAQAASSVIDTRYAQEDDAAVVAAGGHYNLMSYYLSRKQFSKYKAGLSLMRLASSLTFVKPSNLVRALKLLNDLKDNIELVEDPAQRADLEAQVDAQLDNLKAQLGQIGAKASVTSTIAVGEVALGRSENLRLTALLMLCLLISCGAERPRYESPVPFDESKSSGQGICPVRKHVQEPNWNCFRSTRSAGNVCNVVGCKSKPLSVDNFVKRLRSKYETTGRRQVGGFNLVKFNEEPAQEALVIVVAHSRHWNCHAYQVVCYEVFR